LDGVTIRLVRIYRRQPNSPAVRVRLDGREGEAEELQDRAAGAAGEINDHSQKK